MLSEARPVEYSNIVHIARADESGWLPARCPNRTGSRPIRPYPPLLDGEAVNGLRVALAFELQFYACPDRDTEPVRHALREHDLTPRGLGL